MLYIPTHIYPDDNNDNVHLSSTSGSTNIYTDDLENSPHIDIVINLETTWFVYTRIFPISLIITYYSYYYFVHYILISETFTFY